MDKCQAKQEKQEDEYQKKKRQLEQQEQQEMQQRWVDFFHPNLGQNQLANLNQPKIEKSAELIKLEQENALQKAKLQQVTQKHTQLQNDLELMKSEKRQILT